MKNLPVYLIYYIIPIISFGYRQLYNTNLNFEFIYILLLGILSFFFCNKILGSLFHIFFCYIFLCYCLGVFFIPALLNENTVWRAFAIEMKWFFYIILAYGWITKFGVPESKIIYKGATFLSVILVINKLLFTFVNMKYSRYYELIAECNYDVLLVVLGFIMKPSHKYSWIEIFLFIGSIFFTGSLTGSLAIVGILACQYARNISIKNIFRVILLAIPCVAFLYWLINLKYSLDDFNLYQVDRFIFFAQAWEFVRQMSITQFIFGFTPGVSLDEAFVIPEFVPYVKIFCNMNSFAGGVYPFYFHASYIREILTLGIPLFLGINGCFLYFLFQKYNLTLNLLAVTYFIFATSLSIFTITNGAFLFFFIFFSLIRQYRISYYETK